MNLLTIGGIDSRSGGGINSDLAAFERFGFRGFSAVTSIVNVFDSSVEINKIDDSIFESSLSSISEFDFVGVKTGLLLTTNQILKTAEFISSLKEKFSNLKVVVDPVIVFKEDLDFKNDEESFLEAYAKNLFPIADLITPNSSEFGKIEQLVRPFPVILKNRNNSELEDILYKNGEQVSIIRDSAVEGVFAGAGCSHSAIALAFLAKGNSLEDVLELSHSEVVKIIQQGRLDSV